MTGITDIGGGGALTTGIGGERLRRLKSVDAVERWVPCLSIGRDLGGEGGRCDLDGYSCPRDGDLVLWVSTF